MLKGTQFWVWGKTPSDTRDTASALLVFAAKEDSKIKALDVARCLDGGAIDLEEANLASVEKTCEVLGLELVPSYYDQTDIRIARGHGVTIQYPSGYKRNVRG